LDDCFQLINEQTGATSDFRVIYPPDRYGNTGHHVALDVKTEPGKPTSIVGYESALESSTPFSKENLESHIPNARVTFVHNLTQCSHYDCVMFALNNALKSFKARGDFTAQAHRRTQDAGPGAI